MTTVVLFTVAISLGETPTPEECAKLCAKMEVTSNLVFGNAEVVEAHVEPEPVQTSSYYHVTGQVTLTAEVNSAIFAPSEELARQEFIRSAVNGLDISIINDEKLDLQDKPDILVTTDIDIEEVTIAE
jgi:hypothetical protein